MMHKHAPHEIVRWIASGGMGEVYEGRTIDPWGAKRPVAIKLMRADLAGNSEALEFFRREAETSLALNNNHPNLVSTYGCLMAADGRPYLVMEYVDGVSLNEVTRAAVGDDDLFFAVLRRVTWGTLLGLMHLHANNYIHRDVSPGNLLLGKNGTVKLADMGLCKTLDSATSQAFRGTLAYASAEALCAQPPSEGADLYSLAAVLYELLTGMPPYGTGTPEILLQRMCDSKPRVPEDTPPDLAEFVEGLLAADPRDRAFQSVGECVQFWAASREPVAYKALMSALTQRIAAHARVAPDVGEIPVLYPSETPAAEPTKTSNRHASTPPAKRRRIGLAMVAMIALGCLGHAAVDLWRDANRGQTIDAPAHAPPANAPPNGIAKPPEPPGQTEVMSPPAEPTPASPPAPAHRKRARTSAPDKPSVIDLSPVPVE